MEIRTINICLPDYFKAKIIYNFSKIVQKYFESAMEIFSMEIFRIRHNSQETVYKQYKWKIEVALLLQDFIGGAKINAFVMLFVFYYYY